jgi:hypothetical protein
MRPIQVLGVVLLVLGIVAVVTGGFSFTKDEKKAEIGPVEVRVEERERVNVPLWAGVGALVVGAVLLVSSRGRAS